MPQINRIRVNNVKYNFGTQFYDDFVMKFSCKNTIYDLANGGGKSVLMLLLLQNLIPNCTLDEKQPIEKLFRTSSGSTTIHSLIEWKLDNCYIKDNYKYMTTGFCARKARESGNEGEVKDTANIEYFNYCIFYRSFGDNDIKNLPLSKGGERITYNGLKAYLRDLEKNDLNVSVKIFERKGDYQKFLTEYGIFESEWEIVRGINKTEGHVRTYFETNYKTGRKVVEDLLIEEIIQKSFANRIGGQDDEGQMAKTLLDIKDKLVELSKKKSVIADYDKQIKAMEDFSESLDSFNELFVKKESLKNELINNYIACSVDLTVKEKQVLENTKVIQGLKEEQRNRNQLILAARIKEDKDSLKRLNEHIENYAKSRDELQKSIDLQKEELAFKEVINQYEDYLEYKAKSEEIKILIDNRLRDFADIKLELAALAAAKKQSNDEIIKEVMDELALFTDEYQSGLRELESYQTKLSGIEKNLAVYEARKEDAKREIDKLNEHLSVLSRDNVAIAMDQEKELFDLTKEAELINDKLEVCANKKAQTLDNINTIKNEIVENKCNEKLYLGQMEASFNTMKENEHITQRLSKIYDVYKDKESLERLYKKSLKEIAKKESSLQKAQMYKEGLLKGIYPFEDEDYKNLKAYLEETYGEDVLTGDEWVKTLPIATRRDVLKRIPFVSYSFVIKEDFERIREDLIIPTITRGSYAIPIIGESILRETRHAVNSDYVIFGMKDLSFLHDDNRLEKEIKLVSEEIDTLFEALEKEKIRHEVIESDYHFVMTYDRENDNSYDKLTEAIKNYESSAKAANDNIIALEESLKKEETLLESLKLKEEELKENYTNIEEKRAICRNIIELNRKLDEKYVMVKEFENLEKEALSEKESVKLLNTEYEAKTKDLRENIDVLDKKVEFINKEWNSIYSSYYDESIMASLESDDDGSRFKGLKSIIEGEAKDVSDKMALIENYETSMSKVVRDIEYKGFTFADIEEKYKANNLKATSISQLMTIRKQIEATKEKLFAANKELDAQNALVNRLEGSISHALLNYNEKYGEFIEPSIDNPQRFIDDNKVSLKGIEEKIKEATKGLEQEQEQVIKTSVIKKELERILENADIVVPSVEEEATFVISDYSNYEENQKEFSKLIRAEYKKKENFEKDKIRLKDALLFAGAMDLANEIIVSVKIPQNSQEVKELKDNIKGTNECIALEKDRILKSIEDMERIKDNFENRCIQTCSNIKTELDRLPKLSKITMDDEVISIIGLNIPYVKEETYKERMSSYINETVTGAESFKDPTERLKYIRNRLAWKKLFSVIVNDMNGIRLNLYKRERIKDQSRYLRYEEAVGSTGQSQGIYIQFLIAIINYISNINALAKTEGLVGKVIFIDNPFGAAKDIYIWEPIFKLLKTNHVQLIVPARGATPAITGRFDVNYILGQKLKDGKQQTVVVDYRSQVQNEEMDYTKLEFEQTTFDI